MIHRFTLLLGCLLTLQNVHATDYPHQGVEESTFGEAEKQYWLYEPSSPKPASAPVIVFTHGWGAMDPKIYGAWIVHLCKRGNIVIFPRYQGGMRSPTAEFTDNTVSAVKEALNRLKTENGRVRPQEENFATVGHSVGGLLAANLAASPDKLPPVKVFMSVEPGKTWTRSKRTAVPLLDLSKVPSTTRFVAIYGDQDKFVKDTDAKRIFEETTQVPAAQKTLYAFPSKGSFSANHAFPTAKSTEIKGDTEAKSREGGGGLRGRLRERIAKRRAQHAEGEENTEQEGVQQESIGRVDELDAQLWKMFDELINAALSADPSPTDFPFLPEFFQR